MRQQNSRSGQALVEYALSVVLIIGVFTLMNGSIKRGIGKIWKTMAQEISAGCPNGCQKTATFQ